MMVHDGLLVHEVSRSVMVDYRKWASMMVMMVDG